MLVVTAVPGLILSHYPEQRAASAITESEVCEIKTYSENMCTPN
jgi:hypothetical protein